MIAVRNIAKSFGNVKAVDDLSFTIKEGEIVGLLGPNGAGKTTTMRMVTGFLSPDRGSIEVNGVDMGQHPIEAARHIGYLPENNPLYKEMLVSEFLDYTAQLYHLSRTEQQEGTDFAVSSTDIGSVYFRPIRELSKGFRQRVGMAGALLHRPKILIFDEPTEGYDPNQRADARKLIKSLAKHHTVVISSHVLAEVEAVANRVVIINRGKLVADATPQMLAKNPHASIRVTIEGDNVPKAIEKIKGVKSVEPLSKSKTRPELRIYLDKNARIEPALTKLAGEKGWTIWYLSEDKQNLESVFSELTR